MLENAWPQMLSVYLLGFIFLTTSRQHPQELKQLKRVLGSFYFMKSGTLQHWKRLCLCQHSTKNLQLWSREPHRSSSSAFTSLCSNLTGSRSLPIHPQERTSGCPGKGTAQQWPGEQGDDTQLTWTISSEALQGKAGGLQQRSLSSFPLLPTTLSCREFEMRA